MELVSSLEHLGREVREEQDDFLAGSEDLELRREEFLVRSSQARPRRSLQHGRGLMAVAAAALLGGLVWFSAGVMRQGSSLVFLIGADGQPGAAGAFVSAPAKKSVILSFSDGTVVDLKPQARIRVVSVDANRPELVLESGEAEYRVVHRPNVEWRVSSGPFTIHVVGTGFTTSWDPAADSFELAMHQGEVRVSGCLFGETGRALLAGESLRASCSTRRFEVTTQKDARPAQHASRQRVLNEHRGTKGGATENRDSPAAGHSARNPAPAQPAEPGVAASASWQELARRGKYPESFAAAQVLGFSEECERLNAGESVLLADVARYAGRTTEARAAYLAVRRRFPGSPQAATAAYSLGKMAFDGSHSYAEAARWFQGYLQEQPGGVLAREALGRLLESRHRAHNLTGAQSLASQYLSAYPNGPHAGLAREILGSAPAAVRSGQP